MGYSTGELVCWRPPPHTSPEDDTIFWHGEAYAQDDAARLETEGAAAADGQAVAP